MKLLLLLIPVLLIPILGMFYWMYKSKTGELNLSQKSWHFKLLHWMWDVKFYEIKNACPYYWSIWVSLLVLPLYVVAIGIYKAGNWMFNKLPSINWSFLNKLKFVDKLPTINIPTSKREIYNNIYKKGKDYLKYFFIGVLIILLIGALILLYIIPFIRLDVKTALILTSFMTYILISFILTLIKPDWDEYHIDHYKNFGLGLFGIVSIPFVVVYYILETIFSTIFKTIKNYCPPIVWDNQN
mgnify:CR=1 FL=1